MSQVRKLLQGNGGIPKTYNLILDGQTFTIDDDQLTQINNEIASLNPRYRAYLGGVSSTIASGTFVGNRAKNEISVSALSNLNDKELDFLREGKQNLWEAITDSNTYRAKEAINEALNIVSRVVNKTQSSKNDTTSKAIAYNRKANFDYDTVEGKQVFSSNPKNQFIIDRFKSYLDWLSDDTWDNSNQWEEKLGDNEAILRSWYNNAGDRTKAQAIIDNALNEVRSKPWEDVSETTKELLAYFNIGNGSTVSGGESSSEQKPKTNVFDENGKIKANATNEDGTWQIQIGDGTNNTIKDAIYTSFTPSDSRPYLINKDRLAQFGLDDSYINSIVYQNRIYKPEEVAQNVQLATIMNDVIRVNNSAKSTDDVWKNVGKLLNFTDNENHYVTYNSDTHYMPYSSYKLRNELGKGTYALADITNSYDTQGNTLYEIYDFNDIGSGQWGFRNPFYYIPAVGRLNYIPEGYKFLNRNWNPMNAYSGWQNINGKEYGLIGNYWGSDSHDTIPYQIFEDRDGNFFTRAGDGRMIQLDPDLVNAIVNENFKPNHRQMLYGTLSGKRRGVEYQPGGGFARVHKEGGKVELKPLPAKLQMGSKLSVAPNQPEQISIQESPLAYSSNVWETLTPADQKEIIAAGIDVAGAIAGLVPGGSIAGAVSGLGSTGLFMSAAKERKGHLDASDWGQAALATGLDLVSLVPYLGETGKIAKIAKAVTRVAVPLGKAFSLLGLSQAASVLSKDPKDWDTNDLLKLSAGIQSVINIGHSAHVRRGESALASEISKVKGKPNPNSYSLKIGDNDIVLTPEEVKALTDKSNNAEEILQGILRGRNISDDQMPNLSELLGKFGFDVKSRGIGKNKRTVAVAKKPEQNPEYTKYGWLLDDFDPSATREFKRREYIDNNLTNDVRAKLKPSLFETNNTTINGPRETIAVSSSSLKNTPEARAYIQSLARQGQVETSWFARPKLEANETITVDRTPGLKADAEAAIARGEGLPNVSEMAKDAGKAGMESINAFAESTANINAGVSKAMGSVPGTSNNPSIRLGAESVSSKELRKYIIGNAVEKGLSDSEAIEFLNRLSENKRRSVISELRKSKSQRAKDILNALRDSQKQPRNRATLRDTERLVKTANSIKQRNIKTAFDEASLKSAQMASNLKKLRSSKNPMQTLNEISREQNMIDIINTNPKQFREALNEALRNGIYKRFTGPRLDRSINRIEQQRSNLGLIFKKGGIIKAQKGYTIRWKWTDADGTQRIDETQYEGAVPPRDALESLLAEERDKRTVWKKTGLEKSSQVQRYPEYEIIYPSSDNATPVRFESGSGNSQHLLPEIPAGSSSYGLNTNYEVSPYQTFAYSNLNPQNNIGDIIKSVSKPTEQKIVKVKTNKQKDFNDLVNILENLLDKRKNGGVIKAQSGLKFSVPSEIEVPSNLSTDLINKIAYRPNTDWGTYVNGKYTPFGLLGPYQLKYETNAQRYDDARNAFIDAYGLSYNPQSKSYLSEYGAKDVIEQPVEESLPGNETPLPELNDGWHTPTANDAVQDTAAAIGQKIPAKASSSSTVKKNNIGLGGGYNYNISDKTKWINPLISTFRYGLNAWAQRRYTDQAIKAINAGRFNELPVWQNLPVMTNPTLDRQLQQVHLERMAGMKPVTSDLIANNALWNQREGQLYDRENDIYSKQSAFQWDAAREGLNIMNQNLANQIKVANDNRARSASLNSAIEQQKMAFIQMLNQSRQNALLEVQNNVMNDRKTMLAYEQNQYNQQLQRDYDSYLRRVYSDAAYDYSKLDYAERSKYNDLEDYILRNVPGSAEDISTKRSEILNNQLRWNRDNALNYNYGFLAGKTSKASNRTFKKGGRVNGTTRYTLDPDERIWVDNNKAAHAGVAKLTDNVIKLILRALK